MSDRINVSELRKEFAEFQREELIKAPVGEGNSLKTFTVKVLLAILDTLVDIKHQLEKP